MEEQTDPENESDLGCESQRVTAWAEQEWARRMPPGLLRTCVLEDFIQHRAAQNLSTQRSVVVNAFNSAATEAEAVDL